jgi:hypothetical protein
MSLTLDRGGQRRLADSSLPPDQHEAAAAADSSVEQLAKASLLPIASDSAGVFPR